MWSVGEAVCVVHNVFAFSTEGSIPAHLGQTMLYNYRGNTLASVQQLRLVPQGLRAQHPMAETECLFPGIR